MLIDILEMLIAFAGSLFGMTLVLRAYMNRIRIGVYNDLAQFVRSLTDPILRPFSSLRPRLGMWDVPALLMALVIAALQLALGHLLRGVGVGAWVHDIATLLAIYFRWILYLALFLVFAQFLLALVNPSAPLAPTFDALTRPMLVPVRRALPKLAQVDLSPAVVIVLIQIALFILDRSGF